jgi:hypothetical protein
VERRFDTGGDHFMRCDNRRENEMMLHLESLPTRKGVTAESAQVATAWASLRTRPLSYLQALSANERLHTLLDRCLGARQP